MSVGPFSLQQCLKPPRYFLLPSNTHLSASVGPIFNPISPFLRFNYDITSQRRNDFSAVYASNNKPTEENSRVETSDEIKSGQGPPFLTILAGFIVFFLVGWLVWSILVSLIGPIVHLFSSK